MPTQKQAEINIESEVEFGKVHDPVPSNEPTKNDNRYLLFAGTYKSEDGGWDHYVDSFSEPQAAVDYAFENYRKQFNYWEWYHIVDLLLKKIIDVGGFPDKIF